MSVIRFCRAAALGALLVFVPGACATRRPETSIAPLPISRTIVWKVAEGDQLRVRIYREPDLSGESAVTVGGTAFFVGIGRIHVEGLSLDSLQADISARYGKFLVDAAVDVTVQRDIVVYGQVRTPGVFLVDPSTTVLGLLAKAGGASGMSRSPILTLVKADGRQYRLPREARLSTMDITRSDAVYVQEESVWARNQQTFGAVTLAVTLVSSVLGLIFVLSR
jgi:polysaccharide export outer membrane protein